MLKERHYKKVDALVTRYKGDLPEPQLSQHLERVFEASTLLEPLGVSRPDRPKLIPTADGPISRMLLTIPAYAVAEPIMAAAYQSLLHALPKEVRLVVLVQAAAEKTVRQWLMDSGHLVASEISTFDDSLRISVWAEDGYVVARDENSGQPILWNLTLFRGMATA